MASLNFDFTHEEARKRKNKDLNRYRDVSPYDHSRVVLKGGVCDYINASLVQVRNTTLQVFTYLLAFVLTLAPLTIKCVLPLCWLRL